MSEIVFQDDRASAAELGSRLHGAGMNHSSVRGFVDQVRTVAEQVTLYMTPVLLEKLREINLDQYEAVRDRVQRLPTKFGYIDQSQVLMILHSVFNQQPGR